MTAAISAPLFFVLLIQSPDSALPLHEYIFSVPANGQGAGPAMKIFHRLLSLCLHFSIVIRSIDRNLHTGENQFPVR